MTNDQHYAEDAAAYLLGALEPDEVVALERHMTHCAACRAELESLRVTVAAVAMSAPVVDVPRRLRRRVLAAVLRDAREGARVTRPVLRSHRLAIASAVVAVAVAAFVAGTELGRSGSGVRVVQASVGDASVQINGSHGVLLVARLPGASRGQTYEVWLQRGGGAPVRSTLFDVNSRGRSHVVLQGSLRGVRRVMVTEEPHGGTAAPTTSSVIVATLS